MRWIIGSYTRYGVMRWSSRLGNALAAGHLESNDWIRQSLWIGERKVMIGKSVPVLSLIIKECEWEPVVVNLNFKKLVVKCQMRV